MHRLHRFLAEYGNADLSNLSALEWEELRGYVNDHMPAIRATSEAAGFSIRYAAEEARRPYKATGQHRIMPEDYWQSCWDELKNAA